MTSTLHSMILNSRIPNYYVYIFIINTIIEDWSRLFHFVSVFFLLKRFSFYDLFSTNSHICTVFIMITFDVIVVGTWIGLVFGIWRISISISTRMTPIKKALDCERLLTFHLFCQFCCCCWIRCHFLWWFTLFTFYKTVFISFDSTTGFSFFLRAIQWKWNNTHRFLFGFIDAFSALRDEKWLIKEYF